MLGNWVKQSTSTTGVGPLTLATALGYPAFSDQFAIGQPFYYTIVASDGSPVEAGIGRLTASNTLERTVVLQTMVGGILVNTGATAVDLPAGTYTVVCDIVMQNGAGAPLGFNSLAAVRGRIPYPYHAASNTRGLSANSPRLACGRIDSGRGVSALGVNITTAAGTAADKIRVGVYAVVNGGDIGPLVCESGDLRCDTTGVKSASVVGGTKNIPPGWYYFAMLATASPTLQAGATDKLSETSPLGMSSGFSPMGSATSPAVTAGWSSMPSTLTISSVIGLGVDFPILPIIYQ